MMKIVFLEMAEAGTLHENMTPLLSFFKEHIALWELILMAEESKNKQVILDIEPFPCNEHMFTVEFVQNISRPPFMI